MDPNIITQTASQEENKLAALEEKINATEAKLSELRHEEEKQKFFTNALQTFTGRKSSFTPGGTLFYGIPSSESARAEGKKMILARDHIKTSEGFSSEVVKVSSGLQFTPNLSDMIHNTDEDGVLRIPLIAWFLPMGYGGVNHSLTPHGVYLLTLEEIKASNELTELESSVNWSLCEVLDPQGIDFLSDEEFEYHLSETYTSISSFLKIKKSKRITRKMRMRKHQKRKVSP